MNNKQESYEILWKHYNKISLLTVTLFSRKFVKLDPLH